MSEKDKDKKDKEKKPKGPPPGGAQGKGGQGKGGGEKKARKPKAVEAEQDTGPEEPQQPAPPARLAVAYREKIVPELQQALGYKNHFAVPRLEKIVISMGLGKAMTAGEKAKLEQAEKELGVIA